MIEVVAITLRYWEISVRYWEISVRYWEITLRYGGRSSFGKEREFRI